AEPASGATGDNWPRFRGPQSRGVAADNATLPDTWSTTENVVWKADIPGRGWSSPVVWGDKVFLTSVVNEGKDPVAKKGLYFGGENKKPPTSVHRWTICCVDFQTGKMLWEKVVHQGVPETTIHVKNSYASETPVTDGERVYACFGNVGLFCCDLDGKAVWTHQLELHMTQYD